MTILEKLGHWDPVSQKFPQYPKYPKTSINQPSDCFGTLVRPHSMWNVMLKTLDYFSFVSTHDLGNLGPVYPSFPNAQIPAKNKYNSTLRGPRH